MNVAAVTASAPVNKRDTVKLRETLMVMSFQNEIACRCPPGVAK